MKHLDVMPREFKFHNFEEIVRKRWIEKDFLEMPKDIEDNFKIYE